MPNQFAGKTIIVTGASGGIGSACARMSAERGANIVLVDVRHDRLTAVADRMAADHGKERIYPLRLDVTSEADMAHMAAAALDKFSRIDALIAAAGILRTSGQPTTLQKTSFAEWKSVIDINLTGTFLSNRAVLSAMIGQGQGDIVNIGSTSSRQGRAFDGPYSASKFGIVGLSESLAEEVGRLGIRVQSVLPDAVDTPLWEQSGTASLKPRNMLSPEAVAEFIGYLLSMPRDMYLLNPTIYPMRLPPRRKKPADGGPQADRTA
jgi:NAD(P)-dependent dehydrogenase (short-subunit alcohol dehydrogenase family)